MITNITDFLFGSKFLIRIITYLNLKCSVSARAFLPVSLTKDLDMVLSRIAKFVFYGLVTIYVYLYVFFF